MVKKNTEKYPDNWVHLDLMINEDTKEIHVVGGDRKNGEGDQPYIGMELLKKWEII